MSSSTGGGLMIKEEYSSQNLKCPHQWRIIENFHEELPRGDLSSPRVYVYAAYCIYCLLSKGVEVKIDK